LVIPTGVINIFTDPYYPLVIQGVSSGCNAHNYSVMLWLAEPEYERNTILQILHNGLIDGVVVSSALIDDPIVQALYHSKMPFLLIGRHLSLDVNSIDVNNIQGGREATRHLLGLGRKRVATITGPQNMIVGVDRLQGYRDALNEANIPYHPEWVEEGDFTEESGYAAMVHLLPEKPDALFVASDIMAIGALRALREAGLQVPEDVAIIGHDDVSSAANAHPPLTTIRQPTQRLGASAVDMLIDIMDHPESKPRHSMLDIELVIRFSCGA